MENSPSTTKAAELALHDIPVLSDAECAAVRQEIFSLRDHWERRHPDVPFYTLGTASYLDASGGRAAAYAEKTAASNPLLMSHFGWLHERIAGLLAGGLGRPTFYDDRFARPGWHVYLADPAFARPVAKIHCDLQHRDINWLGHTVADVKDPHLSFTLSVALPAAGAGLNHWDVEHEESKLDPAAAKRKFDPNNPLYHAYTRGSMAVHSGLMIHQASLMKDVQPTDERITMQGHGILVEKGWLLYW